MWPQPTSLGGLIAGLGLMLVAVCNLASASFAGMHRLRIRRRAQAGERRAVLAEAIAANRERLFATVLVGNAAGTALVVIAMMTWAEAWDLGRWLLVLAVFGLFALGQAIPAAVGQARPDEWALRSVGLFAVAQWLLSPMSRFVAAGARALARLLGVPKFRSLVTREDLALLIESEPETDKPAISADEREMIANVLELSETTVGDLMVNLSGVTALGDDCTVAEAAAEIADKQHSRLPVFHERLDNVVGIVHVFDVLNAPSEVWPRAITEILRPAIYAPESMRAADLLVSLQSKGEHLSVVVDEYGGAIGIVTIEDLLETVVGDIEDEFDSEPAHIKAEKPGVWSMPARTEVAKVNAEIGAQLPESDAYETIAGLMLEHMRRIPRVGERLALGAYAIEVVAATERSVEQVRVIIRSETTP